MILGFFPPFSRFKETISAPASDLFSPAQEKRLKEIENSKSSPLVRLGCRDELSAFAQLTIELIPNVCYTDDLVRRSCITAGAALCARHRCRLLPHQGNLHPSLTKMGYFPFFVRGGAAAVEDPPGRGRGILSRLPQPLSRNIYIPPEGNLSQRAL